MRRDSTLKEELEKCNKIAKAVIKRSTIKGSSGYEYPPPDSYWASRAQVNSFKKLAISEMNYRKSLGRQLPSELIFSTKFEGFKKVGLFTLIDGQVHKIIYIICRTLTLLFISMAIRFTTTWLKIRQKNVDAWFRHKNTPQSTRKSISIMI